MRYGTYGDYARSFTPLAKRTIAPRRAPGLCQTNSAQDMAKAILYSFVGNIIEQPLDLPTLC